MTDKPGSGSGSELGWTLQITDHNVFCSPPYRPSAHAPMRPCAHAHIPPYPQTPIQSLPLSYRIFQETDALNNIPLQVKPYYSSSRVDKRLHVSHGLGRLEDSECDGRFILARFVRDGQVLLVVRGYLDEQAVTAVTLVELSR